MNYRTTAKLIDAALFERLADIQLLAAELKSYLSISKMPGDFTARRNEILSGVVLQVDHGVFRFKYLSDYACDQILELQGRYDYSPNQEEAEAYQMNEVVLEQQDKDTYVVLESMHNAILKPLWFLLYGVNAKQINSIQLAKYQPDNLPNTGWHYDNDSNCTCVVEITDPAEHSGMELSIFPNRALGKPEGRGWATMFNGHTQLHSTTPIEQGERIILVHWVNHEA